MTTADDGGWETGIEAPAEGSGRRPRDRPARPGRLFRRLITWRGKRPSGADALAFLRGEIASQANRALLWTPVAFGVGAALYLALKHEPPLWITGLPALIGCPLALALALRVRRRWPVVLAGLGAVACLGLFMAKLHSDQIAAPVAPPGLGVVRVQGFVIDIETPSERGQRLLIAPTWISHLDPARTPHRIRVVVAAPGGPEYAPPPGSAVQIETLLDPPPGPASPGAYDFARDAWFEGIGAVGLAMRPPTPIYLGEPPWRLRLEMAVNALRWRVACRLARDIYAVMGPRDGGAAGLAVAVTTSHQDWLTQDDRNDLRGSGLAHMLAIAGLHTAALSGFAFFAVRLAIALWPWLAVRVPGKKVAAVAGLLAVAGYLLLSGAHPPARRAAITASVAFAAILLDRRAISLHALALAALVILVSEPDVVLAPGFEMSFCATASLVAMAEIWPRPARAIGLPWPLAALQALRDWTIGLFMVSFVAGAATGPFAIQHFNRVSNYGVFANLTADFLASVVLMPTLALVLIAQALGLNAATAAPLFWLAGWAAKGVIGIGHLFANAPGAGLTMASAPLIALVLSYLGIVFACLWRGRLRWIGVPMSAAVALWPRPAAPVAWIAADGDDAAVARLGQEVVLKPGMRAYATQLWAQRRGFSFPVDPDAAQRAMFDCDKQSCAPIGAFRPAIGAWWTKRKPAAGRLERLCEGVDILILRADVAILAACRRALVLDRAAFAAGGAAEVFAAPGGGWSLVWSQPLRGDRPWSHPTGSAR